MRLAHQRKFVVEIQPVRTEGRTGWRALWGNQEVNFEGLSPEEAPLLPRGEELRKAERDGPHHGNKTRQGN